MKTFVSATSVLLTGSILAGCSALGPAGLARLTGLGTFAIDTRNLAEPRAIDWQTSRINAAGLGEKRQAFVEAQLRAAAGGQARYGLKAAGNWPTQNANWVNGGTPGVAPGTICTGANKVDNGLACGMFWDSGASQRFVFALSNNGYFMRIPSDLALTSTANVASVQLTSPAAVDSFKQTSVIMNPSCTRAYCLRSTDATLFAVDVTVTPPAQLSSLAIGSAGNAMEGARFLAPSLDPVRSSHYGGEDILYVPRNDGQVYKVKVSANGVLSQVGAAYTLTSATPISTCVGCSDYSDGGSNRYRLAAAGVAFNGHYFIGDMAGNFYDYDVDAGSHVTYPVSTVAGIAAPPALELQSGNSGALDVSDSGTTVTVPDMGARYAFVNVTRGAGPACAWVDLARRTVVFSKPLYLDENDSGANPQVYGKLADYNFNESTLGATHEIDLKNGASTGRAKTVATASTGDLDGVTAGTQQFLGNSLQASASGVTNGGGSTVYFRADASGLASTAVLTDAEVVLTADAVRTGVAPPRFHAVGGVNANGATGYYQRGTTTVWDTASNQLSAANAPTVFDATYVNNPPLQGFSNANSAYVTPTNFALNTTYSWRVLDALAGPVQMDRLAFAMKDPGTYGTGTGDAAVFTPASTTTLRLKYDIVNTRPSFVVETAPILDATAKRCYVQVANVLFCLKYNDPTAWADAEHGVKHTGYQALYFGRVVGDKTGTTDGNGGSAFYRNVVTPVASFNFKYIYAMSYKAQGGSHFHMALSRVTPGNVQNSGLTQRSNDDLGTSDRMSAAVARTDSSDTFGDGSGQRDSYLGARTMMVSPYDNIATTGGDLYVSMSDNDDNAADFPFLYRFGTQ
ncbi:MAG: hypothetical protein VKS61_03455 [Candidatus Sericytochromatia bacterium]|nr:hypothetical protein [Candidatus Sericytochromatia bacterium]